jgi:hypothetical protein
VNFNLPPGRAIVSFSGLGADSSKLNAFLANISPALIDAINSNRANETEFWEIGDGAATRRLSLTSEGDCGSPISKVDFKRICPPGTCEVNCSGHICCYNSEGIAV